ncbi:glycosyltransferase [Desulfoplanes formicivorans]|uniref:Glycosyl transferase family 1 n=1 Tax=Desulfoplanes formicivorans TaxID=1592317 RepID=A0A194AF00_9BACT|nr:glycosyltransferase [Desulfoplanes formicivorans]GAU07359.1 glycosyl transferase family 1 [Desulfoplanes formicivorans]
MKMTIVGPTYPFRGGIAQHTTLLCNTLRLHHDVQFISFTRQYPKLIFPGKTDRDPSKNALRSDPVEYLVDSLNPYSWYKTTQRIIQFKPDKIIFPWWVIFWAPQTWYIIKKIRKKIQTKIIIVCHNVADHENNVIKEKINRLVLKNSDILITQSKEETGKLRKLLGQKIATDSIQTGFHPTYADLCLDSPQHGGGTRTNHELLFFGFVRKYKGLDVLLDALALIRDQKNIHLNIVGEFWKDKQSYLEKIKELGIANNVTIMDEYVPNEQLGRHFLAADLVVQPYLSASGSGVSQLAYGFGKPVIATNVGSIGEVVQDWVNGRLVAPNDPAALARAIVESLEEDQLKKMQHEAEKVRYRFSWEKFAEMITEC